MATSDKFPTELIEDIARRRAVLYIGAGVSASASGIDGKRPPDWQGFLEIARSKLGRRNPSRVVRDLLSKGDLLSACELLKKSLDESWPELLKEQFLTPEYRPSGTHRALHDLDLPLVLTPNFDTLYDRFAHAETHGNTVIKEYHDSDVVLSLRRKYRTVLKIHGSIDTPSKMIFSRGDYARLRNDHREFHEILGALFLTSTFLFVGTSLNDPDLQLFLESYHHAHPSSPPHYMTSPQGEISPHLDESIRNNMNIKLIRYSPEKNHEELGLALQELVDDVALKRDELARTTGW